MIGPVLIIGVGFMGGSLALALRGSGYDGEIIGIDLKEEVIRAGVEKGAIDRGWTSFGECGALEVETAILSTPVRTFRKIAEDLVNSGIRPSLITDLGSVKGKLVEDLETVLGNRFVGGHPIAGTEKSGVTNSREDLFKGKKVILTPTKRTDPQAYRMVREMWERVGAKVEDMDPLLHDWVFGAVSHLPHAVAFALIDAIMEMSKEVDLFKYPGAGFRDFTRIAGSDPVMWRDIFLENRENTLLAIDTYMESLKKLRDLIAQEKVQELTALLEEVKDRRVSLG